VGTINSLGLASAVASGTTTLSAISGGITGSATLTVTRWTPTIISVSPTSATAGNQITITGSGFGNAQGSGTVILGSDHGMVTSWSDTQVVATVATGSVSGVAQIVQKGAGSNSVPFTVNTPTVTNVTPSGGAAGTQVTIAGSGFGSPQGTGQVWLGTAPGQVASWSDGQVVATVAAGSNSGNAQILQNGVWSNPIAFTVNGGPPHIASINPNTGSSGTVVTIQGTGFGSSQGSGIAWIGATSASVNSWSDTQVSATVGTNAVSGVAKVQQNGLWSNAVTFAVPSTSSVTLNPNVMNMLVGETRPVTALNSTGHPVTGLTWTSSDPTIVTLSTDDPPIITAVAPGNATITAGGASADVTVYAAGAALPPGTILWSNPGDGSGVECCTLFPAVPSYTGVADVFAPQVDGSVEAITSEGAVAWTSSVSGFSNSFLADFQGGLVVFGSGTSTNLDTSIYRLDGLTGQPYPAYTTTTNEGKSAGLEYPVIHTDGTIFTVDYACDTDCPWNPDPTDGAWVVGIDPSAGTAKFKVPLTNSTTQSNVADSWCGNSPGPSTIYAHAWPFYLTIAGDGYMYTAYTTSDWTTSEKKSATQPWPDAAFQYFTLLQQDTGNYSGNGNFPAALADLSALAQIMGWPDPNDPQHIVPSGSIDPLDANTAVQIGIALQNGDAATAIQLELALEESTFRRMCDTSASSVTKLHVLRAGTDGSSSDVVVHEWDWSQTSVYTPTAADRYNATLTQSGPGFGWNGLNMITNADTGILISWQTDDWGYCTILSDSGCAGRVDTVIENHLTTVSGGTSVSDLTWNPPGQSQSPAVMPVLQLADGSFVGSRGISMVAFDASGNTRWTVPNDSPQMATADGGIIGSSGTAFDANGNATGQVGSLPTFSWKGAYQYGSVELVNPFFDLANMATTFAPVPQGNLTGNGFSLRHHTFGLKFCNTGAGGDGPCTNLVTSMSFSYMAAVTDSNYMNACDFSVSSSCDSNIAHPEWVSAIKIQALNAYKAAFAKLPAIVSHNVAVDMLYGGSITPDHFEHTLYIDGQWFLNEGPGCPHPGKTTNPNWSWVFYMSIMCDAQHNLPPYGNLAYFSPPFSDAANFAKLAAAIGRGIGNTAAHETGHQIAFSAALPGMDCGPGSTSGRTCEGANSVYEAQEAGPWNYLNNYSPPIQWEPTDLNILQNYFKCTAAQCK
jgi:hypothetical protein